MLMFSDWSSLSPSQKVKVHGPRKVILGHFNDFGHFPIEIPIEVKKITDSGRSGPTTKTKSVPKSVNKMEQLETM